MPGEHNLVSPVRKLVTVITHGSPVPVLVNEISKNCNFMIGYSRRPFAMMWLVHFWRGIIMTWTSCDTARGGSCWGSDKSRALLSLVECNGHAVKMIIKV